jgi:hypothetical protein
MRKHLIIRKIEIGQVIPLVVLMMFVIIGFIALILDGGALMSNRRTAQAAADAGALAGARQICSGFSNLVAKETAEKFAVEYNGATSATASADQRVVSVLASRQNDSFFAKIFSLFDDEANYDILNANARAVAGCFYPSSGDHVLPISFWYNTPPKSAADTDCSDPTQPCELVSWDYKELLDKLRDLLITDQPVKGLYFVADSAKVCEKIVSGEIVCYDLKQNASGGNRTWIDLGKVADKSQLTYVIQNGLNSPIYMPAWINGETGEVTSVYRASTFEPLPKIKGYTDLPYRMMYVPVYDLYCVSDPANNCSTDPDDSFQYLVNTNQSAYRLVGFAPFVLTCTTAAGKCDKSASFGECLPKNTGVNTTNQDQCPGYLGYLAGLGPKDKAAINTFEGYFVKNVPVDPSDAWGTDGVDAGLYLISLIE